MNKGAAHSSRFDFDEDVMGLGAAWIAGVAMLGLQSLSGKTTED